MNNKSRWPTVNVSDQNSYIMRCSENKDWMRWKSGSNTTEIRLSNIWTRIKTENLYNKHPLDFGNTLDTEGKEDLNEIVAQYEKHIQSSPWLQKLRREYNDVLEKRKLFAAIKGDRDAEI